MDGLNAGVSHVDDLSDADVAGMRAAGFRATTDETELAGAQTIVICVPTPLSEDGGPDLGRGACRRPRRSPATCSRARSSCSSRPPTRARPTRSSGPILEAGGLEAGDDFHLAFSPERIDPGNPEYGITNTPKVVGGHTPACTERAVTFYGQVRRHGRAGAGHARGRDGQAAGEHLPARQHRAGQRDGAVLPRARHRPVGRHPARQRPSRSASRRSTRARASAGTASRSTRTT